MREEKSAAGARSTTRSVRTAVWDIGRRRSSRNFRRARVVEKTQIGKLKPRVSRFAWKSRKRRGIPTFPQPRLLLVYVHPDFVVLTVRILGAGHYVYAVGAPKF